MFFTEFLMIFRSLKKHLKSIGHAMALLTGSTQRYLHLENKHGADGISKKTGYSDYK